jgi:hypothetical protein
MRVVFDKHSDAYAKHYSPTGHLAVSEVIVIFKGMLIFKQCIPKKHNGLGCRLAACVILRDVHTTCQCI